MFVTLFALALESASSLNMSMVDEIRHNEFVQDLTRFLVRQRLLFTGVLGNRSNGVKPRPLLHSKNLATNGGTQDFVPYGILLLLDVVINVKLEGILSEVGSYRISSMLKA